MELFFNLLWLLIALVSLARWRRVFRFPRGARGLVQAAFPSLALICALGILFPSISVSDNLHPGLFVSEDGAGSRRAIAAVAAIGHALLSHPHHAAPPALAPNLALPIRLALTVARVRTASFPCPSNTLARSMECRAPPTL
jgi:hypothetical protein